MSGCGLATATQQFRFTVGTFPKVCFEPSKETSKLAWEKDGSANEQI